jgi:hypothetical protein
MPRSQPKARRQQMRIPGLRPSGARDCPKISQQNATQYGAKCHLTPGGFRPLFGVPPGSVADLEARAMSIISPLDEIARGFLSRAI